MLNLNPWKVGRVLHLHMKFLLWRKVYPAICLYRKAAIQIYEVLTTSKLLLIWPILPSICLEPSDFILDAASPSKISSCQYMLWSDTKNMCRAFRGSSIDYNSLCRQSETGKLHGAIQLHVQIFNFPCSDILFPIIRGYNKLTYILCTVFYSFVKYKLWRMWCLYCKSFL